MSRQLFEYHPVLAFRFIPGIKARIPHESGGYLVQANEAGFRCSRQFERARTPGKRRVLLFGDSFTAGDGVSNGKRYSDVLEEKVPDLEVYNFGLPASGTDQQYLAWREFAKNIEHDLLIIAVLVENIHRVAARYRRYVDDTGREVVYAKPYFTLQGDALTLHHVPPPKDPIPENLLPSQECDNVDRSGRFAFLRQMANTLGVKETVQKITGYQPVPEFNSPDRPEWLLMRAILTRWVREHEQLAPTIIMPLPLYQHVEGTSTTDGYRARFRELCAELRCTLHDPLPDLLRYSSEQRRRFRFEKDVHPTPEGHAAIADSLRVTVEHLLEMSTQVTARS